MAGRPQRRPAPAGKRRAPHPVAPAKAPLDRAPQPGPVGILREGEDHALVGTRRKVVRPLEEAYRAVLSAPLPVSTLEDADQARVHFLRQVAKEGQVTGAQAVAASLFAGVLERGRMSVAAAKELADRTEGPVVQRAEVLSARFVVSVGPQGTLGALPASPATPEEWERMVRRDLDGATSTALPAGAPLDEDEDASVR